MKLRITATILILFICIISALKIKLKSHDYNEELAKHLDQERVGKFLMLIRDYQQLTRMLSVDNSRSTVNLLHYYNLACGLSQLMTVDRFWAVLEVSKGQPDSGIDKVLLNGKCLANWPELWTLTEIDEIGLRVNPLQNLNSVSYVNSVRFAKTKSIVFGKMIDWTLKDLQENDRGIRSVQWCRNLSMVVLQSRFWGLESSHRYWRLFPAKCAEINDLMEDNSFNRVKRGQVVERILASEFRMAVYGEFYLERPAELAFRIIRTVLFFLKFNDARYLTYAKMIKSNLMDVTSFCASQPKSTNQKLWLAACAFAKSGAPKLLIKDLEKKIVELTGDGLNFIFVHELSDLKKSWSEEVLFVPECSVLDLFAVLIEEWMSETEDDLRIKVPEELLLETLAVIKETMGIEIYDVLLISLKNSIVRGEKVLRNPEMFAEVFLASQGLFMKDEDNWRPFYKQLNLEAFIYGESGIYGLGNGLGRSWYLKQVSTEMRETLFLRSVRMIPSSKLKSPGIVLRFFIFKDQRNGILVEAFMRTFLQFFDKSSQGVSSYPAELRLYPFKASESFGTKQVKIVKLIQEFWRLLRDFCLFVTPKSTAIIAYGGRQQKSQRRLVPQSWLHPFILIVVARVMIMSVSHGIQLSDEWAIDFTYFSAAWEDPNDTDDSDIEETIKRYRSTGSLRKSPKSKLLAFEEESKSSLLSLIKGSVDFRPASLLIRSTYENVFGTGDSNSGTHTLPPAAAAMHFFWLAHSQSLDCQVTFADRDDIPEDLREKERELFLLGLKYFTRALTPIRQHLTAREAYKMIFNIDP